MWKFIIGVVVGVVVDNIFAPKVKITDGKLTVEWNPKKGSGTNKTGN